MVNVCGGTGNCVGDGTLVFQRSFRLADLVDGLSQTLVVGERSSRFFPSTVAGHDGRRRARTWPHRRRLGHAAQFAFVADAELQQLPPCGHVVPGGRRVGQVDRGDDRRPVLSCDMHPPATNREAPMHVGGFSNRSGTPPDFVRITHGLVAAFARARTQRCPGVRVLAKAAATACHTFPGPVRNPGGKARLPLPRRELLFTGWSLVAHGTSARSVGQGSLTRASGSSVISNAALRRQRAGSAGRPSQRIVWSRLARDSEQTSSGLRSTSSTRIVQCVILTLCKRGNHNGFSSFARGVAVACRRTRGRE